MALPQITYPEKDNASSTPSIKMYFDHEANEVKEVVNALAENADILNTYIVQSSNPFYGRFTSFELLTSSFPVGELNAWAIIDAGAGITPQIVAWDDEGEAWEYVNTVNGIVFVNNYASLPTPGTINTWYITVNNYNTYVWHNNQYNQTNVLQLQNHRTFEVKDISATASASVSIGQIEIEILDSKVTYFRFDTQYSQFLARNKTDLDAGIPVNFYIDNLTQKNRTNFKVLEINDDTANYLVKVEALELANNFALRDNVEVMIDYNSSTGDSGQQNAINVIDFITDEATKAKVLANDETQDVAIVTQAFNDAFDFCKGNDIKQLNVSSGTYITNKVTIDDLDDFYFKSYGAIIKNGTGNAIFELTNCLRWGIQGFKASSNAVAYADVSLFHITTNSGWINFLDCQFSNMPRCGIRANSLIGGTFTKGITVSFCDFSATANYGNVNQCGIELGVDGEYSKITNNNFYQIPSAVRFVDGANSIFAYNICMEMNGTAYDSNYETGIVYCEKNSNSGKIDITNNKFNHNDSGIVAIVCKGDEIKPQNPFNIQGNSVLVNNNANKTLAVYLEHASNSTVLNNNFRGNTASPNDTAVVLKNSNKVVYDDNYTRSYDSALQLINSDRVRIGNKNRFEDIDNNKFIIDSDSLNVDCEIFSFAISGVGVDVTVADTSPKFMPFDCELITYWISAGVVPTDASLSVGFELNDVSAVSTDASIQTTESTSLTGVNPVITNVSILRGDKVMFPITNIGSTNAGQDVVVNMLIVKI